MDLVNKIQKLKEYPPELHLFCPRSGDADVTYYYDEDLGNKVEGETAEAKERRKSQIRGAQERKSLVLESLQILAYNGPDAEPYQKFLVDRITHQMTHCDICIRVYHKARAELKQQLEAQYSEDEVDQFLQTVFDQINIDRITKGLDRALADLRDTPPNERGIACLDNIGIYAIFETLSCDPFLQNEELLAKHFDEPFRLVQTKKKLRLQNSFLPAMTRFLFSSNETRQQWALFTWSKVTRTMTQAEFDAAVKDPLFDAMSRVQMHNLDKAFLPRFWEGARVIIENLDKELITHSLRALDIDIYKLALDHFHFASESFMDLVGTTRLLLQKSPNDYWDAMGTIPPATIIEQIFSNPNLKGMMARGPEEEYLEEAFSWIEPMLASINTSNITPACRALVNQLLGRFQTDHFARSARSQCETTGLRVLVYTLRRVISTRPRNGQSRATFINAATVSEMLDLVDKQSVVIFATIFTPDAEAVRLKYALDIVKHTLLLDCLSLEVERDMVVAGESLQIGTIATCSHFWTSVLEAIHIDNIALPCTALIAAKTLAGLEPLLKNGAQASKDEKHFNEKLNSFFQPVASILEKLNDFTSKSLESIFQDREYASAIFHSLFCSDESVYQPAVELLKTVSLMDVRRDALNWTITSSYRNTLLSITDAAKRIGSRRAFSPMPLALKICGDVIENLCNPQEGYLRSQQFSEQEPVQDRYEVTEKFWLAVWQLLKVIFANTEQWSNLGHDKNQMMDFCRDTMQFADRLYDQYGVFAAAIDEAYLQTDQNKKHSEIVKALLVGPASTFDGMTKWLRLRDEYLSTKAVGLTAKLLERFKEATVDIPEPTLNYIEQIIEGTIKAKLSGSQKAELERALETYTERSLASKDAVKKEKQQDIMSWFRTGDKADRKVSSTENELDKIISDSTKGADAYKARFGAQKKPATPAVSKPPARPDQEISAFKLKRQQEMEAEKKRRAAAAAKAKQNIVPKGAGMYVSSDESENDDDEFDRELFGASAPKSKKERGEAQSKSKPMEIMQQLPVKKRRQVRTVKDLRARLTPDLTGLHKMILSWDYFHEGDFPPNSRPDIYQAVANSFRTPNDYQNTFMPLLTLEAWQGFVKAREEQTFNKPYEVKIVNRATVDAFIEISSTMSQSDNKEINIGEGDIILLSKAENPPLAPKEPSCLARVFRIQRKKQHIEVSYRTIPTNNKLGAALKPGASVFGAKLESITTLEREYGALMGLQYYDLCDEIVQGKPSPLLNYSDKSLDPIISNYNLNKAQAKAVKSAVDNDAFTLIQGPPGSGKTKTIVAIVGALLTDHLREQGMTIDRPKPIAGGQSRNDAPVKKLLVCAPSNAAVDELVMRFKEGVKTLQGREMKLKVVRLGRSDAINANVLDVTLEELVNKRLSVEGTNSSADQRQKTQELMKEHQAVSEQLRIAREALDKGEKSGQEAAQLKEDFDRLRRRKTELGNKIDSAKDSEKSLDRQADLTRRRIQQDILSEAHIICATLSASGHDMLPSMNIEFETVVVDEAAQCVEMSALIPLKYGCAKCILVGDPKQLPPTVFSREAAQFQYEQSLFVRMQKNHPKDVHLLDTQYRMHPEISTFPSKTFYDGRLLDGANMGPMRQRPWHANSMLAPYRFFDVQGQHKSGPKGHSLINLAEIDIAMLLYEKITSDFRDIDFKRKIGIITPYKSQLRELKDRFARKYDRSILETVDFNTTDAFQGRESEIIIFSCVRASPAGGIGFLQDIRRMNVGLTRAKASLWVLGNSQSLMRGEFWRKLVLDAQARDRYTTGDVASLIRFSKADGNVQWNLQGVTAMEDVEMQEAPPPAVKKEPVVKSEPQVKQEPKVKQESNGSIPSFPGSAAPTSGPKIAVPKPRTSNIRTVTVKRQRRPEDDVKSPSDENMDGIDPPKRKIAFSDDEDDQSNNVKREAAESSDNIPSSRAGSETSNLSAGPNATSSRSHPPIKKKKPVDPFIKKPQPKRPKPN